MNEQGKPWTDERIANEMKSGIWFDGEYGVGVMAIEYDSAVEVAINMRNDMQAQLDAAQQRERTILRLFEDLTPGGSEFHNSPQRVADWLKQTLSDKQKKIFSLARERNQAQNDLKLAQQRIEELEKQSLTDKEREAFEQFFFALHKWGYMVSWLVPQYGDDDEFDADDDSYFTNVMWSWWQRVKGNESEGDE